MNSISVCITEITTESCSAIINTFTTLWRSEIHINLKIDAEALNRRRRRFDVRRTICRIYQGKWRQYAGKCACVYGECSVKINLEKPNKSYRLYFQPNLTNPNLNSTNSFKLHKRLYNRNHNGIAQFYYKHFQNFVEMRNPYQTKNRRRRPEPTLASLWCPKYNMSYLSWTLKAVC
jgi:hypothetical protein